MKKRHEYEFTEFDPYPRLKFKDGFNIGLPILPIKKSWIPFFREMSTQLCDQIVALTGDRKSRVKNSYFHYVVFPYFQLCSPYFYDTIGAIRQAHAVQGKNIEINHKGYSYGFFHKGKFHSTEPDKEGKSIQKYDCEFICIRWKSNISKHEYIHPTMEIDLQNGDITFEICTEVPDEVLSYRIYEENCDKTHCYYGVGNIKVFDLEREDSPFMSETIDCELRDILVDNVRSSSIFVHEYLMPNTRPYDCTTWIKLYKEQMEISKKLENEQKEYRKQAKEYQKKLAEEFKVGPKKKHNKIEFILSENCLYPDVTFKLYFPFSVTKELNDKVTRAFIKFQSDYSKKQTEDEQIHCVININDKEEYGESDEIQMHVDFGNCPPEAIEVLIIWLEKCDLGIVKIEVS